MVLMDGRRAVAVTRLPNFLGWIDFLSYGAFPTREAHAYDFALTVHIST